MAMMDDVDFLISHIRNSFITSDDTGMCELIIEMDEAERVDTRTQSFSTYAHWNKCDSPPSPVDSGLDTSDELSHSYDILPDMDYGAHRRRSNTAQRLERLKKEKRNQCKVKTVSWKDAQTNYSAEEKGYLFEKKEVPPVTVKESTRKGSFLSQQLNTHGMKGDNPFTEYAKFDGRASAGIATKKIDIFLTMAPAESRAYPMPVVVVATAKVEELIGLICWQYMHEAREPRMIEDTGVYWLHIAEDDGEVDMDFPSLDKREPVSKFGFSKLALVERAPAHPTPKKSLVVTVNVPSRGFNKFQVDNINIPMKDILNKVLKRRKIKVKPGLSYYLEKQNEPGSVIDLDDLVLLFVVGLSYYLEKQNEPGSVIDLDDFVLLFVVGLSYYLEKQNEPGSVINLDDFVLLFVVGLSYYLEKQNEPGSVINLDDFVLLFVVGLSYYLEKQNEPGSVINLDDFVLLFVVGLSYYLEKQNEPGSVIDLDDLVLLFVVGLSYYLEKQNEPGSVIDLDDLVLLFVVGLSYYLEKQNEPGSVIDLDDFVLLFVVGLSYYLEKQNEPGSVIDLDDLVLLFVVGLSYYLEKQNEPGSVIDLDDFVLLFVVGLSYYLEKQNEPGSVIDLESNLAATDTMEFCLVRENSQRGDIEELYPVDSSDVAESLTSHQYKSYIVNMVHKLRTNTEVQLGVSGEKVEIDPVTNKGTGRLFKQKAVTYDADNIADCDIVENRSNGKCVFRMMYQSNHDYKHHDFEVEEEVANEIVQKINNILELRLSQTRKDFVANRERKRKRDSLRYS
ncbi:target of rapamycin complex 2 subunit MAPKAP1-like isoform X2 [Haliotis rufescens]|uniref:target of rapamycin complex 2 subunit MAPKAP1-like isoform X2 n=1 Tax=Haliotis rufescens TaxID=6454 RepID=UPI00201EB177|nr:target of rapamycin complex 2 subunit MAPKAP1-like isoform X2 [Haliotis rufescens]